MKARTKLQRDVLAMANTLPELKPEEKAWAWDQFRKTGWFWKKGLVWCQCCGHEDHVDMPMLAVSLGVGSHTCPECGANLILDHWEQSNRQYVNDGKQISFIQTFNKWMVIRTFDFIRHNTRGLRTGYEMHEIYQNWISPEGKEVIVSKRYARSPYYFNWYYNSEWQINSHNASCNGSFEMMDVYDVTKNWFYPKVNVTQKLRQRGFRVSLLRRKIDVCMLFRLLLSDCCDAEYLAKTGQDEVLAYMVNRGDRTIAYKQSLNICHRNHYQIKDASMWFDYMGALAFLNLGLHNAHYVCPKDLRAAHDEMMRRKRKIEEKIKIQQKIEDAKKWEKKYRDMHGLYFGICFGDENIVVTVIGSVKEMLEGGAAMHHCVYAGGYYKKKDSLILSAKDRNGNRLETVEISLKTFKILQSRGLQNQSTPYHSQIVSLVEKNMNLFRKAA